MRFLGATLWTDFELFGQARQHEEMREAGRLMNDFNLVKAKSLPVATTLVRPVGHPWKLSPAHTLARHRQTHAWLQAELLQGEPARTVVVTHHLPSARSVAPRCKEDMLSALYASHLPEDVLPGAALWIHGRAHTSCDYRMGDQDRSVRVVCNPRGYPLSRLQPGAFENPGFDPGFMVEV